MKEILTYDECVRDNAFADPTQNTLSRPELSRFFGGTVVDCPFCKLATAGVHENSISEFPEWLDGGRYFARELVSLCSTCGWWRARKFVETTGDIVAESAVIRNAVLRKYELGNKNVPISILQTYLRDNFADVIHIHHRKMELLVKSVFSEHFSCEVEHIGKSNDGGIDLLLVQSDNPIVVQVKRRQSLPYVESVSGIRELLGATLLNGSKQCIYVSTCSKFSEPSKNAAALAVDLGVVESFELYDFPRFVAALKLTTKSKSEPWRKYLELTTN